MADIAVGYALYLANTLKIEEAFTPNVSAWWEKLQAREGYIKIIES